MAYRKIHDSFWTDPDMEELTPEQKFFYLYLLTNPNVNQIGLYEFSVKRACFETGYNTDTVYKLLNFFEEAGKIVRSTKTKEILIVKFYYHNKSNSPKVIKHVQGLLEGVKDKSLLNKIYSIDTVSYCIHTTSQEEEQEQEQEEGTAILDKKIVNVVNGIKDITDENILLALHIWQDVNNLHPNNQTTLKAKMRTWSEPIRLMVEQDNRTHQEIWGIWKAVQKDEFWKTVVLSTSKLREKFDSLKIKLTNGKHSKIEQTLDTLYR